MSTLDSENPFADIITKLVDEVKTWEGGDLFRKQHIFKKDDKGVYEALFRVHNHIADFDSKYNLDGEYFHTSNSWLVAREWDKFINDNLFSIMEEYNEIYNLFEFTVVEPGNVLQICLKNKDPSTSSS